MTKVSQRPVAKGQKLSLVGDFAGVVLKKTDAEGLTIDVSTHANVEITLITRSGVMKFKATPSHEVLARPQPE